MAQNNGTCGYCDNYKLADYNFITSYCYARMHGYDVNEDDGTVDMHSEQSLVYMKLYPYTLFGLAFLGVMCTAMWELLSERAAAQVK